MSRFSKLSHAIWHCQYYIVWVPKIPLSGVKRLDWFRSNENHLRVYTKRERCEVIELNVQEDHIHLLGQGPTKNVHIGTDGCGKRKDSNSGIQAISLF